MSNEHLDPWPKAKEAAELSLRAADGICHAGDWNPELALELHGVTEAVLKDPAMAEYPSVRCLHWSRDEIFWIGPAEEGGTWRILMRRPHPEDLQRLEANLQTAEIAVIDNRHTFDALPATKKFAKLQSRETQRHYARLDQLRAAHDADPKVHAHRELDRNRNRLKTIFEIATKAPGDWF